MRLSGPVQDATSRAAILSFAAALFGHDRVIDDTMIDPALPEGWPGRVLAGVEALAALKEGRLEVTPEPGRASRAGGSSRASPRRGRRRCSPPRSAPRRWSTSPSTPRPPPRRHDAARPRPEICADQIGAILDAGSIQFAAGSADIVPESRGVIAAIADVLRGCPGADFEIGGHTDSQGSADGEPAR